MHLHRRILLATALAAPFGAALVLPAASASSHGARSLRSASLTVSGLTQALQNETKATFKITYLEHPTSGANSTVTYEQKPPSSLIRVGTGLVLQTGGKTYYCSPSGSKTLCVVEAVSPIASLAGLFSPGVIATELKADQTLIAMKVAGVSVSSSTKTIAGHSDSCESVKTKSGSGIWCVTSGGLLAYASGSGGGYVILQSATTSVSSNDFKIPAGATIESMP